MTQNISLNNGDIAIEPFFDATQEVLGSAAPNFRIAIFNSTTLKLTAGADNDQQSIAINGKYRYRTSDTTAAHPGGSAGTHTVYVTAAANNFSGAPPTVDSTDYNFGLVIKTSGTPTGVALYRSVGAVDWDGTKITAFRQSVGSRSDGDPLFATAPIATVSPLQVKGAASQSASLASFSNSSGTPVIQLNVDGSAAFAGLISAAASGITFGDANLYRSAADTLKTDDSFVAGGSLTINAANNADGMILTNRSLVSFRSSASTIATLGVTSGGILEVTQTSNGTAAIQSGNDLKLRPGSSSGTLMLAQTVNEKVGFFGSAGTIQTTGWSVTNGSGDKVFDASATSINELANVVGSLVTALKGHGLLG